MRLSSVWHAIFVVRPRVLVHFLVEKCGSNNVAEAVASYACQGAQVDRGGKGPALPVPDATVGSVFERRVVWVCLLQCRRSELSEKMLRADTGFKATDVGLVCADVETVSVRLVSI